MEINLNFVLFEELKDKSDGGAEARIVIIRESRNPDCPIGDARADFLSPE
jgi:hypothetical protein